MHRILTSSPYDPVRPPLFRVARGPGQASPFTLLHNDSCSGHPSPACCSLCLGAPNPSWLTPTPLHWCARSAETNATEWLNNRNLFSHSSGGYKSETKVSAGLVLSEGLEANLIHMFPGGLLAIWDFLASADSLNPCLHLHTLFSLGACLCPHFPFS